jgi:hypothetical protein
MRKRRYQLDDWPACVPGPLLATLRLAGLLAAAVRQNSRGQQTGEERSRDSSLRAAKTAFLLTQMVPNRGLIGRCEWAIGA